MTMIAVGKKRGTMLIGSGKGINRGKIAGGQTIAPPNPNSDVFGRRVMQHVPIPNTPGGLIDKVQQKDPSATAAFNHPFAGSGYRGVSTQPLKSPTTTVNNFPVANPFKTVNKTVVTDRGTFFGQSNSIIHPKLIKTQFGAAKTGPKADTAFHPNPPPKIQPTKGPPEVEIAKLQRRQTPPSFATTGNHWSDPHNSFIKGSFTAGNPGTVGVGRWNTVKRSAV